MDFLDVKCCACGSAESRVFCTAVDRLHGISGTFHYVSCSGCGVVFQNPQVATQDIPALYPASYEPWKEAVAIPPAPPLWKQTLRNLFTITGLPRFVQEKLNAGGRLLDIACGNGRFMARIASEHPKAKVEGLDFSPQAVEVVRANLGLTAHTGTLQDVAPTLGKFDVLTMWWYLEHEPDPREILRLCRQLLAPDGVLAIGVPHARSMNCVLFRDRWFHLDPPRHLWIFSDTVLKRLLTETGFKPVAVRYDPSPWGILGSLQYVFKGRIDGIESSWLNSRLLKLLFRPIALLQCLFRVSDTIAVYAKVDDVRGS